MRRMRGDEEIRCCSVAAHFRNSAWKTLKVGGVKRCKDQPFKDLYFSSPNFAAMPRESAQGVIVDGE